MKVFDKLIGIAALGAALSVPVDEKDKAVPVMGKQMGGKWFKKRKSRTKMQKQSRRNNRY